VKVDALIAGGGAAGFFAAIHLAEERPDWHIVLIEKGAKLLQKVRISGGGRCNVTHAQWDPSELVRNYPRGERELLGPFHRYAPQDTVDFFRSRGIELKTEADGRMFPVSDQSLTIVNCLRDEAHRLGVEIRTGTELVNLRAADSRDSLWEAEVSGATYCPRCVLVATGSSPRTWSMLRDLGHTIIPPVPSLFTFKCRDVLIEGLQGMSTPVFLEVSIPGKAAGGRKGQHLRSEGPLLITHWGLSGPAILRLSAWGARQLHERSYEFQLRVDWVPDLSRADMAKVWSGLKSAEARKQLGSRAQFGLPKRLWQGLIERSGISVEKTWGGTNAADWERLRQVLKNTRLDIRGKSTFKDEFVTAGGVSLAEVDFRTYESRLFPRLYFAGEVLDVDALTGGFNFQNAWTGAYHAARAMAATGKPVI